MPSRADRASRLSSEHSAVYRITVMGRLDPKALARIADLQLEPSGSRCDASVKITTLVGRLADQAQLMVVLNALFERRLPPLSVESLREDSLKETQIEARESGDSDS